MTVESLNICVIVKGTEWLERAGLIYGRHLGHQNVILATTRRTSLEWKWFNIFPVLRMLNLNAKITLRSYLFLKHYCMSRGLRKPNGYTLFHSIHAVIHVLSLIALCGMYGVEMAYTAQLAK